MNKPQVDYLMAAIFRLSDCLVSTHPDTQRMGNVPDMMNAAVDEIERLRKENAGLRDLCANEKLLCKRIHRYKAQRDRFLNLALHYRGELSGANLLLACSEAHKAMTEEIEKRNSEE